MKYTVHELGELAGVSARTVRYYDQIGLLKPTGINSSGYRIYGPSEVDRLQQIMFYRELGMSLKKIKEIITSPNFDRERALREHREKLLSRRMQLDLLLANVEKTIATMKGETKMTDQEKFEGFKSKLIEENETKYGAEVRTKYGNEAMDSSNQKIKNMTKEQYAEFEKLSARIMTILKKAFAGGDPAGGLAQKAADLHRQWLGYTWDKYSKEAHAGLAQMYVDDKRFAAYYDSEQPGLAKFLRDAILIYTGMAKKLDC